MTTIFFLGVLTGILIVIVAEGIWMGWLFGSPHNYMDEPK